MKLFPAVLFVLGCMAATLAAFVAVSHLTSGEVFHGTVALILGLVFAFVSGFMPPVLMEAE